MLAGVSFSHPAFSSPPCMFDAPALFSVVISTCTCMYVCMNNTVEKDFFGFPKVKWLHLIGEVDKSVRHSCQIFSEFNILKSFKLVNF